MPVRTEIKIRLPNSPGALMRVCRALADERVNVLALMLEENGQLHLLVDNHVRALGVLREQHHQVALGEVAALNVSNAPGALAPMLALAASAGINVEYAYGGAREDGAGAIVVLGVDDPVRACALAGL